MRLEARQHMRMSQELRLAPQMIQSMEILQLPTLELMRRLEQELQENPVLELKAETPEDGAEPAAEPSDAPTEAETKATEAEDEGWDPDWAAYRQGPSARSWEGGDDPKLEAMQNTASRPASLQDLLTQQFLLLETGERQQMIARNLIYNIDDNGYLPYTLEQIAASMDEKVEVAEIAEVLALIQTLDPPGVGARDLKECLLLQLGKHGDPLARLLLERHLEDIEANRFPKIAKETGRSIEEIKEVVEFILSLHPKPGTVFGGETPPSILPDVIVEETEDGYEVRVESGSLPEVRISPHYRARLQKEGGDDPRVKEYLKRKVEAARWILDAIQQRHDTLLKIAKALFARQRGFLDQGVDHLVPLKMQEVADEVGVHVSTVSRAISEKYAQTPRGIFALKYFFTGGTQSQTTGEMASWETVKRKVLECVAAEDKANPLSDGDIEAKLKADGLDIARRTVTKYRKLLKIPSSRQRRVY